MTRRLSFIGCTFAEFGSMSMKDAYTPSLIILSFIGRPTSGYTIWLPYMSPGTVLIKVFHINTCIKQLESNVVTRHILDNIFYFLTFVKVFKSSSSKLYQVTLVTSYMKSYRRNLLILTNGSLDLPSGPRTFEKDSFRSIPIINLKLRKVICNWVVRKNLLIERLDETVKKHPDVCH